MLETRFYVGIMAVNSLCHVTGPYIDVGITHHVTWVAITWRFTFLAARH